jgi:acyl-CoA synthetase (AMP-forming)/AMP-acid ligase II
MKLHTLADIFSSIVEKKWRGNISESDGRGTVFTIDTLDDLNKIFDYCKQQGISFGDKVVLKTDLSCRSILYIVALWKIGAVVVPVKSNNDLVNLRILAKDCNAKFFLDAETDFLDKFETYQEIITKFQFKKERRVCGTDLALIIYTSGSTGVPKGIMLTHNNVIVAMNSIVDYLQLREQDKILCISPLSFDYGLYQILFSFATCCSLILFNQPVNPMSIINVIDKYSVTVFPLVPTLFISLSRALSLSKSILPSLQKITNTGGHLPEETIKLLHARLPHVKIYAMYGLTESKRVAYLPPEYIKQKLGSVGIPMPGLEAKVCKIEHYLGEEKIIEVEPDEVGVLFVRGPSIMQGYTSAANQGGAYIISGDYRDDNWLCTNDLFHYDEDGFLYYKGRTKDLIKQGGYCLYAKDIEDLISQNTCVALNAVISDYDNLGNEIAHCIIQVDSLDNNATVRNSIIKWIDNNIDNDYKPRKISFLDIIPISENGKIDKKTLKNMMVTPNLEAKV